MLIPYRSRQEESAAPTAAEVLGGTLCAGLAIAALLTAVFFACTALVVGAGYSLTFASSVVPRALAAVICFLIVPVFWHVSARLFHLGDRGRPAMRFSERMRWTMAAAVAEVARRNVSSLETHHLLLGLFSTAPNTAVTVLEGMGVEPAKLSAELEAMQPVCREVDARHVPLPREMPGARAVLHWAVQEAEADGARIVGTEHLLLALAREHFGHAGRVLRAAGVNCGTIADALAALRQRTPGGSLPEMTESDEADDPAAGA